MPKVVLFNGPPRSGKDTAGLALRELLPGAVSKIKFSDPVKDGTHALYGLKCDTDAFENCKDIPNSLFLGLTPRQAYINASELFMKVVHGPQVFGEIAANRVIHSDYPYIIVPDSGFFDEGMPLVSVVGADNILLMKIYREGKTFEGDSRNYINLPNVTTISIKNPEGNVDEFKRIVCEAFWNWIHS